MYIQTLKQIHTNDLSTKAIRVIFFRQGSIDPSNNKMTYKFVGSLEHPVYTGVGVSLHPVENHAGI